MHERLLKTLLPNSYRTRGPNMDIALKAEGYTHDQLYQLARDVENGLVANTAGILLSDWEQELSIAPKAGQSYQERVAVVVGRLVAVGGLSIPYFINVAQGMGCSITIDELDAFRAGRNRAGDPIYIEDIMWVWRVSIKAQAKMVWYFRAGQSVAGERLSSFGDPVIETLFKELKPAHTHVIFTYQEQ